jgi:fluoride exporter
MKLFLLAAAGGAIGAGGRYLASVAAMRLLGPGFPWGTLFVNVVGCFLMGLIIELAAVRWSISNEMRTFLATGVLGGFTTFSAFSLDFAVLVERKSQGIAFLYAGATVGLTLIAIFAGMGLARALGTGGT